MPKDRWPEHDSIPSYISAHWQEPWGDRRQEIVFIGSGIDWADIKGRLDAALVSEDIAKSPDTLPDFTDPFPYGVGRNKRHDFDARCTAKFCSRS